MKTSLPDGFKYTAAFMAGRPKHDRFDDFSIKHPQMERGKRAKLFAPFDALDGYSECIDGKNVEYVERKILEPLQRSELNRRLQILQSLTRNSRLARENHITVSVTYFVPCTDMNHFAYQMKGQYVTQTGVCRKVDPDVDRTIIVGDAAIPLDDVIEIVAADETLFENETH